MADVMPVWSDPDPCEDAREFLEHLDCVLARRYKALGSFAAVMAELGQDMDAYVAMYDDCGKPWATPFEHVLNALDEHECEGGDHD